MRARTHTHGLPHTWVQTKTHTSALSHIYFRHCHALCHACLQATSSPSSISFSLLRSRIRVSGFVPLTFDELDLHDRLLKLTLDSFGLATRSISTLHLSPPTVAPLTQYLLHHRNRNQPFHTPSRHSLLIVVNTVLKSQWSPAPCPGPSHQTPTPPTLNFTLLFPPQPQQLISPTVTSAPPSAPACTYCFLICPSPNHLSWHILYDCPALQANRRRHLHPPRPPDT